MREQRIGSAVVFGALGLCVFFIVAAVSRFSPDYGPHIEIAQKISGDAILHPVNFLRQNCYPLWHVLTRLVMIIFDGRIAAAIVSGLCGVCGVACSATFLRQKHKSVSSEFLCAMCIVFAIVSPVFVPWFNKNLILGQSSPNLWHNPTHLMVRAVGFPILVWVATILDGIGEGGGRVTIRSLFAISGCLVLSALAKPSFLQIFMPAAFLIMLYKLCRFRGAAIKPIAGLIMAYVPALCVVVVQFGLAFTSGSGDGGFEIAFLKLMRRYSPNVAVSILLVSLFPVYMLVYSLVKRNFKSSDALAWGAFLIGTLQILFLIEKGRRMWHGNFGWGYGLGVFFIWFFAIDKFMTLVLEDEDPKAKWYLYGAVVFLVPHVLSGICYFWRLLVLRVWT